MRKLALISFLMVAALFWGCGQTDLSDDFKQNGQLRMEIKGYVTFSYDPLTCQLGFNREDCEFRVNSDNMSDFFILKLNEMSIIKRLYLRSLNWKEARYGCGLPKAVSRP